MINYCTLVYVINFKMLQALFEVKILNQLNLKDLLYYLFLFIIIFYILFIFILYLIFIFNYYI